MSNVVEFNFEIPLFDFQDDLERRIDEDILHQIAQQFNMPFEEVLFYIQRGIQLVKEGKNREKLFLKGVSSSFEEICFSGIILKQIQEVSQNALMIYDETNIFYSPISPTYK